MVKILYPLQTSWIDYPDNISSCIVVCMMGCDNGCYMCQNPDFQNPQYLSYTKEYTVDELINELKLLCDRNQTNKVVLSGGDPLSPCNIKFTKEFLEKNDFDVCIYTGHSYDYVMNNNIKGFKFIKCGKFDYNNRRESYKTDDEMCFASPNQQLYNEDGKLLSKNGIYKFN